MALISVLRRNSKSYRNIFDRRHATFEFWYRKFSLILKFTERRKDFWKWNGSYFAICTAKPVCKKYSFSFYYILPMFQTLTKFNKLRKKRQRQRKSKTTTKLKTIYGTIFRFFKHNKKQYNCMKFKFVSAEEHYLSMHLTWF